ncbi:MAG: dihydroorotase family protein [Chlamydiales bacterium]
MKSLIKLPALIDPHVHFRVPGESYKEDWRTAAKAAIRGGVTTVCDMPNNSPPCTTFEQLQSKKKAIDGELKSAGIPLRYGLYFGADKNRLDQIALVGSSCIALKIFMGSSHKGLVIDTDEALHEAFQRARDANLLVAVHAEDEAILAVKRREFAGAAHAALHSRMRPREAAISATARAIELAKTYQTPLYLLHISTKEELDLVRQAKREKLPVYMEVTPNHLFLNESDYAELGTLAQINPPLREAEDQEALWEGIRDGTIDTIGTDHAPHTLKEKQQPFGKAPSGIPGIETLLPLMLDAVQRNLLTLDRLIELTRKNAEKIFKLPPNEDVVVVDLEREKTISDREIFSKCGWTPYRGKKIRGWPIYTQIGNQLFDVTTNPRKVEGKLL